MGRVVVVILHPEPSQAAGPLVRALAAARLALGERLRAAFATAGADECRIVAGPPDDTPFGARLRSLARPLHDGGLVVLGSGSLPLATVADLRRFVETARSGQRRALANGWYSADAVALGRADLVADLPDIEVDNVLPRWLEGSAGVEVGTSGSHWRLGVDIDSPIDLVLAGAAGRASRPLRAAGRETLARSPLLADRLSGVAAAMADPGAEVVVAGRTSAATLRWLETATASRTRALVEERGLRASRPASDRRPPASALGLLLRPQGAWRLGDLVPRLGDAAVVDTRVLLAARLGADERRWPSAEDRFASDLLMPAEIRDPWLRDLTASAVDSAVPIVLGGHTLVGPGLRLLARVTRSA